MVKGLLNECIRRYFFSLSSQRNKEAKKNAWSQVKLEVERSITTRWRLFERKSHSQFRICPCIPYWLTLWIRRLWGTESKAFAKSKNTTSVVFPLSNAEAQVWNRWISWDVNDNPVLKPYWWTLSRLCWSTKTEICFAISFSSTLTTRHGSYGTGSY